jgi:hypothetical protein
MKLKRFCSYNLRKNPIDEACVLNAIIYERVKLNSERFILQWFSRREQILMFFMLIERDFGGLFLYEAGHE